MKMSCGWRALGALGRRSAAVLVAAALFTAAPAWAALAVREFDFNIVGRKVDRGDSTIRVQRGETVLLRWRTDEAVLLHVHGYDVQASLSPGASTSMRFVAGVAGRFAIAAHEFGAAAEHDSQRKKHREITLLYLEVLPE